MNKTQILETLMDMVLQYLPVQNEVHDTECMQAGEGAMDILVEEGLAIETGPRSFTLDYDALEKRQAEEAESSKMTAQVIKKLINEPIPLGRGSLSSKRGKDADIIEIDGYVGESNGRQKD